MWFIVEGGPSTIGKRNIEFQASPVTTLAVTAVVTKETVVDLQLIEIQAKASVSSSNAKFS